MAELNIGITGTDGIVPGVAPKSRWTIWGISDIFTGGPGANRYVPKVNDYVIDQATYTTYIVEFIDPVTLLPTLNEIRPANMSFSITETDVLFGVGPGTQSDTYRAYLDTSVVPHILAVDVRLKVGGSLASYAKIFKSTNLGTEGVVISKVFDNNGNFISENVPLELVAIDSHVNYSIKTISVCHTTEELLDGEIVTAVIYNDQGHVVSKRQLLIENTGFIRSIDASRKYIASISLESPFLSASDNTKINFPLNIPINALNMIGVVEYSDGSRLRLPVDGTKFKMFGVDQYVSNIVGQNVDLVLSYFLAGNETSYAGISQDGTVVSKDFTLTTINPNNSYAVKLFCYPVWIDLANGYRLDWWLFNLERNVWFPVGSYINFSDQTGVFNPKGYGYLQRMTVSINLRDVNGSFESFRHIQSVDVVLNNTPYNVSSPWTISAESNGDRPAYGIDTNAVRVDATHVDVSSGMLTQEDWIALVYGRTYPMRDAVVELVPPTPTHFILMIRGVEHMFTIAEWNTQLAITTDLREFETIKIRFIKHVSTGDLQLSIAAMMVKV